MFLRGERAVPPRLGPVWGARTHEDLRALPVRMAALDSGPGDATVRLTLTAPLTPSRGPLGWLLGPPAVRCCSPSTPGRPWTGGRRKGRQHCVLELKLTERPAPTESGQADERQMGE